MFRLIVLWFSFTAIVVTLSTADTQALPSATQQRPSSQETCTSSAAHYFDFLIGEWTGVDEKETLSNGGPPPGPTRFRIGSALDGCALHEQWSFYPGEKVANAELWRAYDKDAQKWTLYFVNDALRPQVWDGRLEEGVWEFYRHWELNGKPLVSRQSWLPMPGGFKRRLERSSDDGKTWTVMYTGNYIHRPFAAKAEDPEIPSIRVAAMEYIDGRAQKDAERLGAVFTDSANLYFRNDNSELTILPGKEYVQRVANNPNEVKQTVTIESIDHAGSTAIVKIVNRWDGNVVTDYLVMVKIKDDWKIVSKVFDRNLVKK